MNTDNTALAQAPNLQSQDLVAGLGSAPRDLLATCLALFEDSTLKQRLSECYDSVTKWVTQKPDALDSQSAVISLQQRAQNWKDAVLSDEELRLVLWMRLREAFDLPPLTFGALRSARTAADDLVSATLKSIQPDSLEAARRWTGIGKQRDIPTSLDTLARQTLAELVSNVMQGEGAAQAAVRDVLLREMKQSVEQLDDASRAKLLRAINAREFNDDAIRTMLLTGSGLASFGGAVSLGGFSAYILAAQASAFIPLVSGPALVSFVAVLSNPVTIVLATVGVGWWATRSANQKIQSAIAMRVIALLALTGMNAGDTGLRGMSRAFARLPTMRKAGELDDKVLEKYRADWKTIALVHHASHQLSLNVIQAMERPFPSNVSASRWERLLNKGDGAAPDMAAMGLLTLGELAYHIHSLDPAVLAAADFSRSVDLDNPIAFAAFAHAIEAMGNSSHLGAISNLKGYVAEQVVANQLVQQGHVVELPDTANEPGWDIAVDGVQFQVKNAADLNLLDRHFEKGYEFPILANAEVADLLAKAAAQGRTPEWADQVHFVEGYSQQAVQDLTEQSLQAGDGMLHPHVPVFAVTLAAIRQWRRFNRGQVSGSQAVQEVLVNGTLSASLAVAGNYAGIAIGLLVFGPAGALVLGSALPILSRTQLTRARKLAEDATQGVAYAHWQEEAQARLDGLIARLEDGLKSKADVLKARASNQRPSLLGDYLRWRVEEEVRFLREAWLRLQQIERVEIEEASELLLVWISTSTLHPATYQREICRWMDILSLRPTLGDNLGEKKGALVSLLGAFEKTFDEAARKIYSSKKR